ncbi:uncharacterized protein LOC126885538 [Diabrotica virgifera virgifera]|uniref:Uncharacterized protein n=1 Tax=Diabrotica virgifera virgifera TaxID=50390 RepID=A0ABM5KD09_DIAVI|nr:uncharacterized protein LOC126885538 [Diabrotica virgifera virgifera]
MDQLKREKSTTKSAITRVLTWITKYLDAQTNSFEIDVRKSMLISSFNNYNQICDNIESLEGGDLVAENRDEVETNYCSAMARLENKLHSLAQSQFNLPLASERNPFIPSNVKLPPISVPTFHGEYSKWVSFYQLFTSLITDNQSISNAQKLIYLKSALLGEPLTLIESLEITNDNFDLALDILKKKYSNDLAIINSHINSIIDYPSFSKSNQTLSEFINESKKHVDSLKLLNVPVKTWDLILINILSRKLDFASKRYYGERRNRSSQPTLTEFFDILNERCNILSDLTHIPESKRDSHSQKSHLAFLPEPNREPHSQKAHTKTHFTSLHSNTSQSTQQTYTHPKCSYCNAFSHRIYSCRQFLALSHDEKHNFIRSTKMCSNCLGTKHSHNDCISRGCSICNRRHHSLLHQDSSEQNRNPSAPRFQTQYNTRSNVNYPKHSTQKDIANNNVRNEDINESRNVQRTSTNSLPSNSSEGTQINSHRPSHHAPINDNTHSSSLIPYSSKP